MTELAERYILDTTGSLIDIWNREFYDYPSDLVNHLNQQQWRINDLESRNNNQKELLTKIWKLIENKDWKQLTKMVENVKEADKRLKEDNYLYYCEKD